MSKQIQNFFKTNISQDWSIGTGNFYVTTKPTITDGWLVISPNNSNIREIVKYTSTGTDINGDYVVVSERGIGGTTEQTHIQGEPIRMNITAEYWADMNKAIDDIVAAGAPDAATDTKGLVEIATDAEALARTVIGDTGANLVLTPANASLSIPTPIVRTYLNAVSPATWTKPARLRYIEVEVQAGGGGGGGVATPNTGNVQAGGGGGSGGTSKKLIIASALNVTETVTIGIAGTAGTALTGSGSNNGGNGGNSSFGTHVTTTGGIGGIGTVSTASGDFDGGNGGTAVGGDININGQKGEHGATGTSITIGGAGASSLYGVGGPSSIYNGSNTQAGTNGTGYGSGGSGAGVEYSSQAEGGGAGAPGIVIVTEFY